MISTQVMERQLCSRYPCGILSLNKFINASDQCTLWHSPNNQIFFLAILEYHHGGDAPDSILACYVWILISVELVAFQLPFILL
uniref:Thioredoxin M-type n=1 Tax=Arundo donax TaxID=35708 RepID=A0A0A9D6S9_ARUDO